MKSKPFKRSRRNFLEQSLALLAVPGFYSGLGRFVGAQLLSGGLSKAYAQSLPTPPRRFVSILQKGAPARWMYDLFLTPYSTANFQPNPMVGTCYQSTGGRYEGLDYRTTGLKGIQVPMLWAQNVPAASGGQRPMSELLDNLLAIQGISTGNAGHPGSVSLHYLPSGALQSRSAMNTDLMSGPLEAISLFSESFVYQSNGNSSLNKVSTSGNIIENTISPFLPGGSLDFNNQKNQIGGILDSIDTDIEDQFLDLYGRARSSVSSRESSRSLSSFAVGVDLDATWNSLLNKYNNLINQSLAPGQNWAHFTDLPIGTTGTRDNFYRLGANTTNVVTNPDIRDLFSNGVTCASWARGFAIAEYLLTNDLSYSVCFDGGALRNVNRSGNLVSSPPFDEHFTGGMMSLIVNAHVFRALSTCLLELFDQLKAQNLFSDTVVEVFGEFNRSPRQDADGSDHGWQGKSLALYSGAFSGPVVIGELMNSTNPSYPGSWGIGAHHNNLGGPITCPVVLATMSHILRTPSPFTAVLPELVTLQPNGQLTPNVPLTRIVA